MMFGDVLRRKAHLLLNTSDNKYAKDSFWAVLKNIAVEDIRSCYPEKVDSSNAIAVYYSILKENTQYIPEKLLEVSPSNNQEKFRIKNRNMWSSNAFHPDGLANQPGIVAEKKMNETRRGYRIIYQGDGK